MKDIQSKTVDKGSEGGIKIMSQPSEPYIGKEQRKQYDVSVHLPPVGVPQLGYIQVPLEDGRLQTIQVQFYISANWDATQPKPTTQVYRYEPAKERVAFNRTSVLPERVSRYPRQDQYRMQKKDILPQRQTKKCSACGRTNLSNSSLCFLCARRPARTSLSPDHRSTIQQFAERTGRSKEGRWIGRRQIDSSLEHKPYKRQSIEKKQTRQWQRYQSRQKLRQWRLPSDRRQHNRQPQREPQREPQRQPQRQPQVRSIFNLPSKYSKW